MDDEDGDGVNYDGFVIIMSYHDHYDDVDKAGSETSVPCPHGGWRTQSSSRRRSSPSKLGCLSFSIIIILIILYFITIIIRIILVITIIILGVLPDDDDDDQVREVRSASSAQQASTLAISHGNHLYLVSNRMLVLKVLILILVLIDVKIWMELFVNIVMEIFVEPSLSGEQQN